VPSIQLDNSADIVAAINAAGGVSADEVIPFEVTLAVAATSETLFTVPAGKSLTGLVVVNEGTQKGYVSMTAGAAATNADLPVAKREVVNLDGTTLAEGTYAFIGDAGETPTLRGFALVG
jgi:hypothetical protein